MEDSPVRKRKNRKRRVNRAGLLHATILLLGTVVFSSCLAPQQIFTTEIDEFGWPAEREVTVEVSNADTVSLRSLHVVVRYGNEYTPEPLDLSVTTVTPDGYRWIDTLSVPAPEQRSAYGLYQDIEQPYRRQTLLNRNGRYVFIFRPITPRNEIKGVAAIGIDIRPDQLLNNETDF